MLSSMCHHAEKYHTSGISEIMYAYVDGNKIPVNPVQKFNLIFISRTDDDSLPSRRHDT